MIHFNRRYSVKNEKNYIDDIFSLDKQSGDGKYTHLCHIFLKKYTKHSTPFLTTSCTHSLEMSALLLEVQPGDEVIMPSFTFVSTANTFLLPGAKIIFCDSQKHNPNLDIYRLFIKITTSLTFEIR